MIATLIFVISCLTLLEFFVSYCHFVIAESRSYELSEQTREISGIAAGTPKGDEFKRLKRLIELCPEAEHEGRRIQAVSTYFSLLTVVRALFSRITPRIARRIEAGRGGCAYVAAVVLDNRIAYNRGLVSQQMGNQF
jgi:hypothetical protein